MDSLAIPYLIFGAVPEINQTINPQIGHQSNDSTIKRLAVQFSQPNRNSAVAGSLSPSEA
jgi:hypothetical protein